jgi:sugar phosphate isomerase/epimerase
MLQFYMGAIQFALGDLPASTIPSARIKPTLLAQERMGWRLGLVPHTFLQYTFSEAVGKAAELGLLFIEANDFQAVGHGVKKPFNYQLTNDDLREVRLRLDEAGIRLISYRIRKAPESDAEWRQLFEFGRKMGIETFIAEPSNGRLDVIERLCDEHEINFAFHKRFENAAPTSVEGFTPQEGLKLCEGRSKRLGICGNMGAWLRAGLDPVKCVRELGARVAYLQVHDVDVLGSRGHDVPWGTGAGKMNAVLKEVQRLSNKPVFGLEFADGTKSMAEMAESVKFFNKASLELDSKK